MVANYSVIDGANWKRTLHCHIFRGFSNPLYCVTVEMDVTAFLKKIRRLRMPFTFGMIFTTAKCANDIEEFRYRFLGGKVVLFDRINTTFTYIDKNSELFKVVNVEMRDTLEEYVVEAEKTALAQKEYFTGPSGSDVFQFSPIPWVSYTQMSHTFSGDKENACPLFNWGRYFERDGRFLLPFSVQVHHSFVDGLHIGRLVDKLQEALNEE
ncbi:CatA-like O-acetyltransferase [Burkholderia pseudomallei]|uniref:CatA-like O-acetyltransferase n=1 Tax=Burkholderia pseudomallei TaxID=28450 RepID=UPI000A1A043D|nr:CatA-like O-acetyltransferase [Burkholderia pseudomallei]ARK41558.1 chloramphenicol acetyltransferase [Burkholderia pseudomallei]